MEYLDKSLKMSNGLTAVFVDVLSLNAPQFATSDQQIDMAIWLASRDQTRSGIGTVGFDVREIPWRASSFEEDKAFILQTIDAAKAKEQWEQLDYHPNEEWIIQSLDKFRQLIEDFTVEFVSSENYQQWQENKPKETQTCPIHGVYHHWGGCVVCNN